MATLQELEAIRLERAERYIQYAEWDMRFQCRRIERAMVLDTYNYKGEERVVAVHKRHGKPTAFMRDSHHAGFWIAVADANTLDRG